MASVIQMPKLSDTMEEGGIANWLKKEGDAVREGEPLVEIETDKATQEYESPGEGVILKILVQPGKTVPLNTPIAILGAKGEAFDLDKLTGGGAAKAPSSTPAPMKTAATTSAPTKAAPEPQPKVPAANAAAPQAAPAPQPSGAPQTGGRIKSSPLARRVAEERGLDVAQIHGSGPGGRVVLRDLEGASAAPKAAPAGAAPAVQVSAAPQAGDTSLPVSMMRKTIAKRLLSAKNDAPHFYLTISANMRRANEWRERLNADAAKSDGRLVKVSVNDLVIMAAAKALRRHPLVNASWQGETITLFGNVHVAMAVALPEGLVTPVIRETDRLGLRDIAARAKDLAGKAKDGKLSNADYSGGTFTISNLGMFGIEEFTAIINPPQVAILAVGATQVVPAVNHDGEIVAEPRMKMTLSCDHRVVDGATGAQFLQTLVRYLEDPLSMMA